MKKKKIQKLDLKKVTVSNLMNLKPAAIKGGASSPCLMDNNNKSMHCSPDCAYSEYVGCI